MTILASVLFFGWIPFVFAFFLALPPQKAVINSYVFAWLFLPNAGFSLPGLPDYTKISATNMGVLLAVLFFDSERFFRLKFHWFDLPILVMCFTPFVSALSNEMTPYDGLSLSLQPIFTWGLPYLIGRLYFSDLQSLRALAVGILVGGLIYVPFCLYEIRMSPTLHATFYGFGHFEGYRLGGWRPQVFLLNGLELGMYMTASTLIGYGLLVGKTLKKIQGIGYRNLFLMLLVTTILCRSTGALLLLVGGVGGLWAATRSKGQTWVMWLMICVAPVYMALRTTELWSGDSAVELTRTLVDAERAQSLDFRFVNEETLVRKAMERPLLGWAGWGRSLTHNKKTGLTTVPDGLWIIFLGLNGLVGLSAFTAFSLLPAILTIKRYPVNRWREPEIAPTAVLSVLVVVATIDNLSNAMINPLYTLAIGGLMGAVPKRRVGMAAATRSPAHDGADLLALNHSQDAAGSIGWERPPESESDHRLVIERLAALAANPSGVRDLAMAHERYGRFLGELGRRAEAEASWQSAMNLRQGLAEEFPEIPLYRHEWAEIQNNLAWMLVNDPNLSAFDASRAIQLASAAVQIDPEHGGFWNTLGVAHYRGGDWDGAALALEKSAKLGPSAYSSYFLAMVHARRGDPDRARDWFARGTAQAGRDAPGHSGLARLRAEVLETL